MPEEILLFLYLWSEESFQSMIQYLKENYNER